MLGSEAGGVNTHSTADDWILGFLQSNQIYLLFMSVMPVIKGRGLYALLANLNVNVKILAMI